MTDELKKLDPREKRMRAIELMGAEGGVSKETLWKECQLDNQQAFSRLLRDLRTGDHYAVVGDDGNFTEMDFDQYTEWQKKSSDAPKAKAAPKKDLKDLQGKRRRHLNSINAKRVALGRVQIKYNKDPNDQLSQIELNISYLMIEKTEIIYNRWKAKCATDLELGAVSDLDSIVDLDAYVADVLTEPGEELEAA